VPRPISNPPPHLGRVTIAVSVILRHRNTMHDSFDLRDAVWCRVGSRYPTRIHSRDAGYPNFVTESKPDGSTLCGGIVSGPYPVGLAPSQDGPVSVGTDVYENDRNYWRASEVAVDYSAGLICAAMGYATLPDQAFAKCGARSPFTGRSQPFTPL
jgi:hypothetical protein